MQNAWYNYRTGRYDQLEESPEDFSDYVPQIGGRGLYQIWVDQGMDPKEAALKVLKQSLGIEEEEAE
jgi:hypothetical protein